MLKRALMTAALAVLIGCQVEETNGRPVQAKAAAPVRIASKREDFAKGTMTGLQVLPEGALALKRKNLLQNSSFEWDHEEGPGVRDGLAYSWGIWGKDKAYHIYGERSVPSQPNEATQGTRSQQIDIKAKGKEDLLLIQEVRDLAADLPYSFSADVKVDAPGKFEASVSMNFYAGDKWHSAKGSECASPTKFTRLSVTGMMPKEANRIRCIVIFRPKVDNAVGTVWVDAAQLEQSDKPTAYCAGYGIEPGEFVSPPIDLSATGDPYKFSWIASQPAGADLRFQIRTADSIEGLASAKWHGPAKADAYAVAIESGPNLLANPSVEQDSDNDKTPDLTRTIGYGENDRQFVVVPDAHSGEKTLKVEITKYEGGNGRWEVWKEGPFEKDTEYAFSLWHKESAPSVPVSMSVALHDARDQMHWGRFGQTRTASAQWKRDILFFRTPKDMDVKRLYLEMNLTGVGCTITDDYSLRRVVGSEEWPVNPIHRGAKWLQYRAVMGTSDSFYSPKLFQAELTCGTPAPELRWLNVLAHDGRSQKYSFYPGETALIKPQVIDFTGVKSITRVEFALIDPSGQEKARSKLTPTESVGAEECFFAGKYRFPETSPLGEWRATVDVTNGAGQSCREMVVLKVRKPYTTPPRRMVVGALVNDYGFRNYKGEGLKKLIEEYRSCTGLEIWKLAVAWNRLEPMPGEFNQEVIEGFREFIAAAHAAGAQAQITIQQQCFPEWVNNGDWDNGNRYHYPQTKRLTNTWIHLANALKDCAGLESYLLINEENHVRDADAYLRAMAKVQSAVRGIDADLKHRITIRPNTREPYIRTRIATDGAQDYDYGSGGYPTHSSWYYKEYANPVSQTSYLRMAAFHASPLVFGGPGGIGEVGFFIRTPSDPFGDEERLEGFKRAMKIAYEMGMDEYMLWGGAFSFDKLDVYCPKLIAFRDELLKTPRPDGFDVCVVMDTDDNLYVSAPPNSSRLDMTKQPLAPTYRFLDGKGYVWFYTTPEAMAIQAVSARATVKLSELKGKGATEQERFLMERLKGVTPSGAPMPWPGNAN